MTAPALSDRGAIVVHHRRHGEVGLTVVDLIEGGVAPQNIVVVDNSEQPELGGLLLESLPDHVSVLAVPNLGYGHAVNAGVRWITSERPLVELVAVVSHEVRLLSSSFLPLFEELTSRPRAAAAGPLLVTGRHGDRRIWSAGGELSRWLLLPEHLTHGTPYVEASAPRAARVTDWLDGACVSYRIAALRQHPFSDEFFLYSEEIEQHIRMRKNGLDVVVVPSVVVWQSSEGVPYFRLGRSLQTLYLLQGTRVQRTLSVRYLWARMFLRRVSRGRNPFETNAILVGRRNAMPRRRGGSTSS